MITNNLISIILPVYNGGIYLKDAIESMINQKYRNFELIIINDGSSDNSINIIQKFAKKDDRIQIINRENRGLITSLNEGIAKSKGLYIVRMDQDDISLVNRLEIQYNYMLNNNLDICGGDFVSIDKNNNILRENIVPKTKEEILIAMASNVPFAHPSVMIRKSFLVKNKLKYGLHGDKSAEDLDLWILMYNNGAKFGNVSEIILQYRILSTSLSRKNNKRIKQESDTQFNNFVKENLLNFKNAINILQSKKINSDITEKNIIRAVLRYTLLSKNLKLLFRSIYSLKLKNIIIGFLSFIKLKITFL